MSEDKKLDIEIAARDLEATRKRIEHLALNIYKKFMFDDDVSVEARSHITNLNEKKKKQLDENDQ